MTRPSLEDAAHWDGILSTYSQKSNSPYLPACLPLFDSDAMAGLDGRQIHEKATKRFAKGMGLLWRFRNIMEDLRYRKLRQPVRFACRGCGKNGWGTARANFCSKRCATRTRVRRFRQGQTCNA